MNFAVLVTIGFLVGFIIIAVLFFLFAKKLMKGAMQLSEKRSQGFEQFAKNHGFNYSIPPENDFVENLKKFHLFSKKEYTPMLNAITEGQTTRDVPIIVTNMVSGSSEKTKWDIFDYAASVSGGGRHGGHTTWHCTVFHATVDTANFPTLIILHKSIFDFWESFTPNSITIPKVLLNDTPITNRYRVYGGAPNMQSLVPFLELLSNITEDINMETKGNEIIFYTRIANYPIFETSKLEAVFLKLQELIAEIPKSV